MRAIARAYFDVALRLPDDAASSTSAVRAHVVE
jgi:hypothetical protein